MKNINSIVTVSRTWFDRVNGNTYYSAKAVVDGVVAADLHFQYGSGSQIEHDVFTALADANIIQPEISERGYMEAPWRYCERMGINRVCLEAAPVARKRDLRF
jgi:hypothetical protein